MKQHEYEVTVKHIADAQGNPSMYTEALQFKAITMMIFLNYWRMCRKQNWLMMNLQRLSQLD